MSDPRLETDGVSVLGTLAEGVVGWGDRHGLVVLDQAGIEIDWWIGADDAWRVPSGGDARTVRPGVAPAIDARVRVPGGEAVLRAYAVAGERAPQVIAEVENASAAPFVIAWVVRAAPGYRIGRVSLEGSTLLVDGRARIELPRPPLRWAVASRSVGVRESVFQGTASAGRFEPVVTRRGDLEIAVLFPVAHRTRLRLAATVGGRDGARANVGRLPALADVERGWEAALDIGMQVELPDAALQAAVDAARATVLLAAASRDRSRGRDRAAVDTARTWGLGHARPDDKASRPPRDFGRPARGRHQTAGRTAAPDPWPSLRAGARQSGASARRATAWLSGVRDALFRVEGDRVELFPHFPVEWLGQAVAVHEAPTAHGPLSFALRWHGSRPALLWEVADGLVVRAPGIDPEWKAVGSSGEALLREIDTTRLLPLGTPTGAAHAGVAIDEPETFT